MNSYTLTSKKIKINILYCFALIFIGFIIINFILYLYFYLITTQNTFIEEKVSKIKHFHLNEKLNRDYIFIGSSKTIYHISTNIFNEKHLKIYNFGVSGNFLSDYPAFLVESLKQKPKNIVISISAADLFIDEMSVPKFPNYQDLSFYFNGSFDYGFKFNVFVNWLSGLNYFNRFSEEIYYKIVYFYNKFNFIEDNNKLSLNMQIDDIDIVDCDIVSKKNLNGKYVIKCSNGDSYLTNCKEFDNKNLTTNNLINLNKDVLYLLKQFQVKTKNNNSNLIIILQPEYFDMKNVTDKAFNLLVKEGLTVINFTSNTFKDSQWCDESHLNVEGRYHYSNKILQYLLYEEVK